MNPPYRPALFWFAVLTAVVTFLLIGLGGLVTSHEAGMSVPDWPTTYGYNMFLFPVDQWVGGVFYEHSHRLLATLAGLLTTILAVWLWWQDRRRWLHWLGAAAFLLVIAQGVLGGLRVRWQLDWLGVPHGAVAQAFLVLTCALALFTSRWWLQTAALKPASVPRGLQGHVLGVTLLIFIQLLIAATMRHQHAGLAITDFPLAYGQLWPDTSPAAIAHYNATRPPGTIGNPITAFQVELQMAHRLMAGAIFLGVAAAAMRARKKLPAGDALAKFAYFWLALLTAQIGLGAATVWYNKPADVATLHVMVGALALVAGALWYLVAVRRTRLA
ncbi:MAG: COX15/CtaA family protein [Verrucomicrobiae bacterium]|nr:COX15/CtaA family protein [Verrucomicrobiae bacterium]